MSNYKFYTPPMLADCLMALLPKKEYHDVIDICCGSWNLLRAAKKRFGNANYVGVDVDASSKNNCLEKAVFLCEDGRKFAINEKKRYDLVLSNPPFGWLKEEERVFKNLNIGIIKELNNKRYENEMMQANLLLSNAGGILLFILPATFFEGETFLQIRKKICEKYTIDSIVRLPIETFGNSKIRTYALILENSGSQKKSTRLLEAVCDDKKWKLNKQKDIPLFQLKKGIWLGNENIKEKQQEVQLFRGNISSAQMDDDSTGKIIFHNSSNIVDGQWQPSIRFCSDKELIKRAKKVKPGDIIVNRVGRFANYWCVSKREAMISDCLIAIKALDNSRVYESLVRNSTNGKLNIQTRGVATKYVTLKDIMGVL